MNYQIRLYDDNLNLLHILDGPISGSIQKRPNNAGAASFSCRHDDELVSALELATNVKIYRGAEEKFAGQITGRDLSGTEYPMDVEGHEARLRALKTPKRWEGWNNKDLADVARDALLAFKFRRFTIQADWQLAYETYQVDTNTEPGSVTVEYEPHPDDPENERPKEFGYLILRLDLGAAALSAGRIVRWSEVVGDTERITIQSRSAATEAELSATAWTIEETVTHVGEVELNEVSGIALAGGGRWLEVKVNLYAMDRETPHKDGQGNITGYGFTPMLNGLEVIWREPSEIVAGQIPVAAGVTVKDVTFDRTNHLQVLSQLCNDLGWEFRVRHDESTHQLVLDLGQEIGGVWQPTIGVDRSRNSAEPIVLRDGDNAIVTTLKDNITNMVGRLHCWGAGDGADQLYALVEDPELSDWPQEDDFTDSKAETIEDLIAAGQAELAKRNKPDVTFEVEPIGDLDQDYGLGDTVTVVHPRTGMVLDCRILEEIVQWDEQGEKPKLGLNGFLYNAMDDFISNPSPDSLPSKPPTPKQVSAIGYYGYNIVSWRSLLDRFAVRYRKAGATDWLSMETKDKRFLHTQLTVGDRWEYQVAGIRGGKLSEWSEVVSAAVSAIDPGDVDIDYTPPATPAFDTCEFVTEVVLRWYPAERAKTYELRTDTNWGQQTGLVRVVSETEYRMRPAQRSYTFYLRARSEAGVYSDTWAEITLTNATPSTPAPPAVHEFFQALRILIQPVSDTDIQNYYLYVTPCDDQGTPTGPTEKSALPVGAYEVTYKAPSGSSFLIEVSAADVLGEGSKSAPLQATALHIDSPDIPDGLLAESKLQAALQTKINDASAQAADYWNQEIGYPTEEDADITTTSYTLAYSAGDVYVGTEIETNPNAFFDLTDRGDNELVDAQGDPVTILDVRDEAGATLLGAGKPEWYGGGVGETVTLILSAAPATSACRVHYAVRKNLRQLAKDALLKKGVTAKQVDANLIDAIENLKGAPWNETLSPDAQIVTLATRVSDAEGTLTVHSASIQANADALALKASQADLDAVEDRVTNAEAELIVQAGQIASKASQTEVDELTGRVTTTESEVTQMGNQYAVRVQTHANGKNIISGFGLLNDPASGSSEFGVMVDKFKIFAAPDDPNEPGTTIFALDTQSGKLYLLADLILNGSITADKLSANALKTLMLQAQLATVDELDTLYLRADKLRVGSAGAPIPLAINPATDHLWHFDGTLQSTQGLQPESGYVATLRPGEGRFGGAVAVEEGTVNYQTDHFEEEVNWRPFGFADSESDTQLTMLPGQGLYGTNAMKIEKISTNTTHMTCASGNDTLNFDVPDGSQVTVSVYIHEKCRAQDHIRLHLYGRTRTTLTIISVGTNVLINNRAQWTWTNTTGETVNFYHMYVVGYALSTADIGAYLIVSCPQVELKSFATSFVDGTRAIGKLRYPRSVWNEVEGTISFWLKCRFLGSENGNNIGIWSTWNGVGRNLMFLSVDDVLKLYNETDGAYVSSSIVKKDEWVHIALTWDEGGTKLYKNGQLEQSSAVRLFASVPSDELRLGEYVSSSGYISDTYFGANDFDELLILPRAATPEEIKAWYNLQAPFYDPSDHIDADGRPIKAGNANVTIDKYGVEILNGYLFIGNHTIKNPDGTKRLSVKEWHLTNDPDGLSNKPVIITPSEGIKIWNNGLTVYDNLGTPIINQGIVTNDALGEIDATKIKSGTLAEARLPSYFMKTAPGIRNAVMYWGSGTLAANSTGTVTFSTAMPYVPLLFFFTPAGASSSDAAILPGASSTTYTHSAGYLVCARNVTTTGFQVKNTSTTYQAAFEWIAICASAPPASGGCSSCEVSCEGNCQVTCKTTCESSCQTSCEVSCQTTCQTSCQDNCQLTCQDPDTQQIITP